MRAPLTDVAFIQWIQSYANPFLDGLFIGASWLGTEEFYLLAIPVIYWYAGPSLGVSIGVLFCTSMYVNSFLKDLLAMPRPDPQQVRVLYATSGTGYGFPSGHAQSSVTFWGYLASTKPSWKTVGIAVGLIFLISLSRLYLGLHFLQDVVGGVLIGVILLFACRCFQRRAATAQPFSIPAQGLLIMVPSLLPLLFYREHTAWQLSGALIGMGWGHMLQEKYVHLHVQARWQHQLAKGLLGIGFLAAWYILAKRWYPEGEAFTLLRYFSLSLAGFFLMPFIFRRCRWEN